MFGRKVSQEYKKMSAGTKRSNADEDNADEAAAVDGGPGLAYMPFVVMEDLLDKLKLLNYEEVRIYNATAANYQKIQDWVLLLEFGITTEEQERVDALLQLFFYRNHPLFASIAAR